jgi:dolichyl-phosphate-mannose-protein mannosyltransferase
MRGRSAALLLLPVALVLVAGTVRFYRLAEPPDIYFDETYYVPDGREVRAHGVERGFAVHPPVGKWLVAAGMVAFGDRPLGWRFASALTGTATVVMVYLAGLRLFRRRGVAALAALLLALDGLAITTSRITMLDAPLALLITAGFWLLLVDRDDPRLAWRVLAGSMFGLALATKWSAVFALAAAGVFVAATELARSREPARLAAAAGRAGLALVVVPAVVYLASYAGWFANTDATRRADELAGAPVTETVRVWVDEQRQIFRFHRDLEVTHPYQSNPATWLVLARPVAYHWATPTAGTVEHVVGMGNPGLWWLGLLAYPVLVFFAVRDRDWRPAVVLGFLASQYVPWLLAARPLFLFYLVPGVPFMALAVALAADRVGRGRWAFWVPAAVGVVVTAAFLFWYPLWSGLEITRQAWDLRIWFDSWI